MPDSIQSVNQVFEIWKIAMSGAQVIVTIVAAFLVYYFAKRSMRNETEERLARFKKDKMMEAVMGFWSLLAYMTDVENELAILVWSRETGSKETTWFIRPDKAKEFIAKLNSMHYEKGYGIFLDPEAKNLFYEYRGILFGLLLAENENMKEKIRIKNPEVPERMRKIHVLLIPIIKNHLDK